MDKPHISLEDYLKDSLYQHIALELKDIDYVYEKFVEYDGCNKLCSFIIDRYENCVDEECVLSIYRNELNNIPNIFFDKMTIEFNKSSNMSYANYFYEDSIIDEHTKNFKNVH